MVRVKRGKISLKRRRNVLKRTKGFRWSAKSKERLARERLLHAGVHAFQDRRKKKRNFRKLWQIKINAASRQQGMPYNRFVHKLKEANIELDRKILAELAEHHPETFKRLVETTKESSPAGAKQ